MCREEEGIEEEDGSVVDKSLTLGGRESWKWSSHLKEKWDPESLVSCLGWEMSQFLSREKASEGNHRLTSQRCWAEAIGERELLLERTEVLMWSPSVV